MSDFDLFGQRRSTQQPIADDPKQKLCLIANWSAFEFWIGLCKDPRRKLRALSKKASFDLQLIDVQESTTAEFKAFIEPLEYWRKGRGWYSINSQLFRLFPHLEIEADLVLKRSQKLRLADVIEKKKNRILTTERLRETPEQIEQARQQRYVDRTGCLPTVKHSTEANALATDAVS